MSDFTFSVLILLLSVLVASVSQILLKVSANKNHGTRLREYVNPLVLTAYAMLLGSTVLTLISLRHLPLSLQPIIESLSYIFVSVMGYIFLKERFTKKKIIGFALILLGIFIFTWNLR